MTEFVRDTTKNYPRIYKEFTGKNSGKKFWIQDLTKEYIDEVANIYVTQFVKSEPITKYSNVSDDPLCLEEFRVLWKDVLSEMLSLICLTKTPEGEVKIAGFNSLCVSVENEQIDLSKFKREKSKKILGFVNYMTKIKNPFKDFGIDKYLNAMGLYVLKDFQGEGLGQEILDARIIIGKEQGFKASLTVFTSTISQKQAVRCGFQEYVSVDYAQVGKERPEFEMKGIEEHTKSCKYMVMLY